MLTDGKFTYDHQLTVIEHTPQNECIVITEGGLAIVNVNLDMYADSLGVYL